MMVRIFPVARVSLLSSPLWRRAGSNRKDKNFRRYASGVERALSLFDTALQEWADYISFLGRLLKVYVMNSFLGSR